MKRLADYSQYFLRSPRLVHELVGHSNIKKTDTVYDIGAGSGVISSVLARRVAQVYAVEVEPRMAAKLRDNMKRHDNVTVIEKDFLRLPAPEGDYKVFANIPFHLSSEIIHKLSESPNPPKAAYLIVQKQFANKLLPDHRGFTGALGMMIGPVFAVRIRKSLKRTDYWPHPNVDTVLLELKLRDEPLLPPEQMHDYRRFTEECFANPRAFVPARKRLPGLTADVSPSQMNLASWLDLYLAQQ